MDAEAAPKTTTLPPSPSGMTAPALRPRPSGAPQAGRPSAGQPGAVIPDGEGGSVVVFGDGRRGSTEPFDGDIYGQHVIAIGQNAPGWPPEGKLLISTVAGLRGVHRRSSAEKT